VHDKQSIALKMNKINLRRIVFFAFFISFVFGIQARNQNVNYLAYIKQYKDLAIEQMRMYRIPASITLAQGLLESGAGKAKLARESNNHFGIKCGGNWRGPSVRYTDDAPNECFRAYDNARDSYIDHSKFLHQWGRYAFLFRFNITDYKSWARGLKQAGYATDPSYANRLITIIEDYNLYQYDVENRSSRRETREKNEQFVPFNAHQVYIANDLAYVIARNGDTFKSIGKEFDISWIRLVKYNDLHKDYTLTDGDIIYLKKKNKKAQKGYEKYIVKNGDSMHSISQKFGIRMKYLYRMNHLDGDYIPEVGVPLILR